MPRYIWKVNDSESKIIIVNKFIVFAFFFKKWNRLLPLLPLLLLSDFATYSWHLYVKFFGNNWKYILIKNSLFQYSKISNQSFAKQINWAVSSWVKYWSNMGQGNWYWQSLVFSTTLAIVEPMEGLYLSQIQLPIV